MTTPDFKYFLVFKTWQIFVSNTPGLKDFCLFFKMEESWDSEACKIKILENKVLKQKKYGTNQDQMVGTSSYWKTFRFISIYQRKKFKCTKDENTQTRKRDGKLGKGRNQHVIHEELTWYIENSSSNFLNCKYIVCNS